MLPLLYLDGLSGGDFVPALGQFPGSSAGLSPAVITRLTETWQAEQCAFAARDLPAVGYVYLWADGIHVTIRLAFYDYPAEYGVHLRTTNPIESIFAAVRHRSKITKGPGSRAAGPVMAVKLIESAQDRWRAASAPHLVALVRAGATFINGKLVERPGEDPARSA